MNSYQWAEGYPNAHENILEKDDVAHVKWGGKWRLPTKEEFAELEDTIHNTTWIPSPIKGRVSWIVKSKRNNQSIRLTAFGYKKGKLEQELHRFLSGCHDRNKHQEHLCLHGLLQGHHQHGRSWQILRL